MKTYLQNHIGTYKEGAFNNKYSMCVCGCVCVWGGGRKAGGGA